MCTCTLEKHRHKLGDWRSGTRTRVFPEAVLEEWPCLSQLGSSQSICVSLLAEHPSVRLLSEARDTFPKWQRGAPRGDEAEIPSCISIFLLCQFPASVLAFFPSHHPPPPLCLFLSLTVSLFGSIWTSATLPHSECSEPHIPCDPARPLCYKKPVSFHPNPWKSVAAPAATLT